MSILNYYYLLQGSLTLAFQPVLVFELAVRTGVVVLLLLLRTETPLTVVFFLPLVPVCLAVVSDALVALLVRAVVVVVVTPRGGLFSEGDQARAQQELGILLL